MDIRAESGFGGTVEDAVAIKPGVKLVDAGVGIVLAAGVAFTDFKALNPGVGIANPSVSLCGCAGLSTGVSKKGDWRVTDIFVEVASGVTAPDNNFCQSVLSSVTLLLHSELDGESESSITLRFFLLGEGMYLLISLLCYIYR